MPLALYYFSARGDLLLLYKGLWFPALTLKLAAFRSSLLDFVSRVHVR